MQRLYIKIWMWRKGSSELEERVNNPNTKEKEKK